MLLDWHPSSREFTLHVSRGEADPSDIMNSEGFEWSDSASTANEAVLFTAERYAAVTYWDIATPRAREPLAWLRRNIEASRKLTSGSHFRMPSDRELLPFQKADLDYILDGRPAALIGDDPGLGKTPTAIVYANEIKAKRVLVVCPASIRLQWLRRIGEWSTLIPDIKNFLSYAILSSRGGVHPSAPWTVISWDLLRSPGIRAALMRQHFDLLILDEAHYAKSASVKRTQAIFGHAGEPGLVTCCDRILALTGTFLPNRPREAYVLARGLCWDAIDFASETAFAERFNPRRGGMSGDGRYWEREYTGRALELQNRLRGHFMTRHTEPDVRDQLKKRFGAIHDIVQVEKTEAIKQALDAERLLDIDPETLKGRDAPILGEVATARRLMGIALAPHVVQYARMLLAGGEDKLVIFAWHSEVLDRLINGLPGALRVDGTDSARSKDRKVQMFINDPRVPVLVGNTLSLGLGTDGLQTVARHCLLAEPSWVMGDNEQAIKRLDRTGQNSMVRADIFAAPGSIMERVFAASLRKGAIVHKALDEWRA